MSVKEVRVDGVAAEVLQAETARLNLVRGGNNLFLVVPAEPLRAGREYEFEFRHSGKVIHEAGEHLFYVSSRGNWYPASGHHFSNYDLTFHFPRELDLVSAGDTVDDRIEGEMRVVRRRTSAPVRIAAFNLGEYEHAKVERGGYVVDVCANRKLEAALQPRVPAMAPPPQFPTRRPARAAARTQWKYDGADRAADPKSARALADAGRRSGVRHGVHDVAVRAAGAAAPDRFANPRHFRTGLPGADLPIHAGLFEICPGHAHRERQRFVRAVFPGRAAGARDSAPMVGQPASRRPRTATTG